MTSTLLPSSARDSHASLEAALREVVDRMDPASAAATRYHLGWCEPDGTPSAGRAGARGGKSLRPTLALLSARAVGAPARAGLPGAVAVELVHNFSLVHDDLMDGDTERRHRPTVWALWGVPAAVLCGDAMLVAAQESLLRSGSPRTDEALGLLMQATGELIRGQQEDLAFERRALVDLAECERMAQAKTGALLSASAAIGAVLADGPAEVIGALRAYGDHLGLAFQLVDDLLGIWGDPRVTGKPVLSDLRAKKKTLPVTYALGQAGLDAEELTAFYADPAPPSQPDLVRAAQLVARAGGRDWARTRAVTHVRQAERALDDVVLPERVRAELDALASFVIERES